MSHHEAGPVDHVHVEGPGVLAPRRGGLEAGSFALEPESVDDGLRLWVTDGAPQPEQVLRLLYRDGVLSPSSGSPSDRLTITLEAVVATDTAVYTRGLRHRLLYRRDWNAAGADVVWFGFNPFLAELDGDPDQQPQRRSLSNVVGMARNHLGDIGRLTILNLFTRRSDQAADITADSADTLTSNELIRSCLVGTDAVIAAWGGGVDERHLDEIRMLWSLLDDVDLRLLAPAKNGRPMMTTTWPQQPRHPSRIGYRRLGLAALPDRWIASFRLDSGG